MQSKYRLTVYEAGVVARHPVTVNYGELYELLLIVSAFDILKAKTILERARRVSTTEHSEGFDRPLYLIERMAATEQSDWMILPTAVSQVFDRVPF